MSLFSKMLAQMGLVERRKDGRVPVRGLEVFYGTGAAQKKLQIRDISPTGIFVLTGDDLPSGSETVLTLGRKLTLTRPACPPVELWARAVRHDGEGVGLTFVRDAADNSLWLEVMGVAAGLAAADDAVERFRVAKALFFLAHRSPAVHQEIAEIMSTALERPRAQKLVALVIGAEQRLEHWDQPLRNDVSPLLIRQILLEGSKATEPITEAVWTQLLTTSCVAGTDDEESLQFADVLSQLLPLDLAIFTRACERTLGVVRSASVDLYCSAEEMREIAHTPNLVAIEQHLNQLYELGLVGRTVKPLKGEQIDRANMTATGFGLQLYARCCEPSEMLVAACG